MPIIASEIKFYLSGGASNAVVASSLGGVVSSVEVTSAVLHNLFDTVSAAEAVAGTTEYRCIYVKNTNGTLDLTTAVAWITANTPSTYSVLDIGVGSSGMSGTEQTVGDEVTAPTSVTFSAPVTQGAGLALGDMTPGDTMAIWLRRTITAGAAAYDADDAIISVGGDTAA